MFSLIWRWRFAARLLFHWQWYSKSNSELVWYCHADFPKQDWYDVLISEDFLRNHNGSQIKNGSHRSVSSFTIERDVYFIKNCKIGNARAFLREWLRPPKAKLEFDKAHQLREKNICTIVPMAWAIPPSFFPSSSFLLSKAIRGSISLEEIVTNLLNNRKNNFEEWSQLSSTLGRFVGLLHENGVVHPDFHTGNLVFGGDQSDQDKEWHLLDLHAVVIRNQPVARKASLENLAVFNRFFQLAVSPTVRLRFWYAYNQARKKIFSHNDLAQVEKMTNLSNRRFWSVRSKRYFGTNRTFIRIKKKNCVVHSRRVLEPSFIEKLIIDPDYPFYSQNVTVLKNSRSSFIVEIEVPTEGGIKKMVYKKINQKYWFSSLLNHFRISPLLRSWIFGNSLIDRYLPTPLPYLALYRRQLGFETEGYLLCEKLNDAIPLHQAIQNILQFQQAQQFRSKQALIIQLAQLIRQMHDRFISHRDLKSSNIFCQIHNPKQFSIWFLDLVGVRSYRNLTSLRKNKDLMRLNVSFLNSRMISSTDKLRFLNAYFGRNWELRANWKTSWRIIERLSLEKTKRNLKMGRVIN